MSAFQKGLIAGIGIFLLLALCVGAAVGVWWLNSGTALGGLLTTNQLFAQTSPTPLANALTDTPAPGTNLNPSTPGTPVAPGGARARLAGSFGLVRAVNSASLTVANGRGTETIAVGNDTKIVYAGIANAALTDIEVDDKVLAVGGRNGNQTAARLLIVAPASYTGANILVGQIASVNGNTFVVTTRQGAKSVMTTANTQMYGAQLNANSGVSLTVGMGIIVIGQPGANGLTAELVLGQARPAAGGNNLNPRFAPTPTPTN